MTEYLVDVTVAGGKYTVRQDKGGHLYALRHGEPWSRRLVGDKLVLALAQEVAALRERLAPPTIADTCAWEYDDLPMSAGFTTECSGDLRLVAGKYCPFCGKLISLGEFSELAGSTPPTLALPKPPDMNRMRLWRVGGDLISAPTKQSVKATFLETYGDPCQDTDDEIAEVTGSVTLAFEPGSELDCPYPSSKSERDAAGNLLVTDDSGNWAEFWPNQVIASDDA